MKLNVWPELWRSFQERHRASDPEVQSPNSSQRRLSCDDSCVWSGTSIGANLTCLGGGLSFWGGYARIQLPFDG
ncbi:hypothetical protein TIFTF001_024018 [Ficus carica]|uniref:Uncharacterized protein n=1 Tax=Ficus carica TaxID=3494 RepID=A0AA88AKL4_FICCA|nr:hypothetical protein TIFTF001_024018 [Ficus carica]